jgi:hypothetical protein
MPHVVKTGLIASAISSSDTRVFAQPREYLLYDLD